ncbi:MAG: glycosyltransferase [Phycisphaeraceae bacterium]|nr:glycosyltransferase [Phycisphaeraceae bacterium]MCW5763693.1 glycosyltransferase [Phycisphaeraceae bacterium]
MNPVLIILPQGASIGGVTTWAITLANALAAERRPVTLLIHGAIDHHASVPLKLHPGVNAIHRPDLPSPQSLAGQLKSVTNAYRDAINAISLKGLGPVLLIPTRDADCFGVCAALAQDDPARVRLVGWRHSPMPYEREIFRVFGPSMSRIIGVSQWLCDHMRRSLPTCADRVACVPNAVDVPLSRPRRRPVNGRPIELVYTGRLDDAIKRTGALPLLSDALTQMAIAHRLTIIGDGPALSTLQAAAASRASLRLLGVHSPHDVAAALAASDVFVLPSRIEGLSLSALEAMAQGCALAITRTPSGASDLIGDGSCGCLADASPEDDDATTAQALTCAVQSLLARDLDAAGRAAHARALAHFSIKTMVRHAIEELGRAATDPPITAQAAMPIIFHDRTRPASVPADAENRLARILHSLAGRAILIHGCGAHTRALMSTILSSPARIVGFADDDSAARSPDPLRFPVVLPAQAQATGATDVVLSSYLHEEVLWARRDVYERQGISVHRLYAADHPIKQPA